MSMTRVSTQKVIKPRAPSGLVEVQYPSTWFRNNEGQKPPLSITLVTNSLEEARKMVSKAILDNNVPIDLAKTFLYHFAKTITMKLDDDWKSYKLTIGEKDRDITPLDIIEPKVTTLNREHPGTESAREEDDPWMAGTLLSYYRLIRAPVTTYKSQIAQRVSIQMKALKSTAPDVSV
ncbi:unnamed protein product [Parnassius apollo]|uniref:(apollo) hypothetical protein n=1 Tax=Parnassius apollo TaxID=110799 RepID=A0A8S3WAY6_PARAO|nr:unnamed protein product [Parnassius apollo]